ncbi:DUF1269 domain-containing protein [Sulfurimonas sediminis]|uniref:DUF1269 domain-containing protein n=1 Tax=Sulfurimonas sediminis TaxID=2590020 RepID=A0A7M1AYQ0_9BACT|nr:DUF1269 domain-containing protein [Sulfurimonas sediminis]QOP42571.1 DUF1269 domain-containing protein [Sulfurimonas sediminis]
MSKEALVKVYDNYDEAAEFVNKLLANGVLKKYISVIAKGEQEEKNEFEYKKHSENIIFWGEQGAFWGGLWGVLMGGILFWAPGVGPIVATGRILASIAGMAAGAVMFGATGAMTAWLVDLGIEKSLAEKYGDMIQENKILVIVHGDEDAVEIAEKTVAQK